MNLEPITLRPHHVARPWGGDLIKRRYDWRAPPGEPIGEWWLLSARPESPSVIDGGPFDGQAFGDILAKHGKALIGETLGPRALERFPLLIKILDAGELLSVQLHPSDEKEPGEGKSEAWMVLESLPDAEFLVGLRTGVDTQSFFDAVDRGEDVGDLLQRLPVKPGDVAYVPAGRIHAMGKDILALEVQQNSDTTYRIFDWHRKPARTLHIEQARRVVSSDQEACLTPSQVSRESPYRAELAVEADHFTIETLTIESEVAIEGPSDRFWTLIPLSGQGALHWQDETREWVEGAAIFVPQGIGSLTVCPDSTSTWAKVVPTACT